MEVGAAMDSRICAARVVQVRAGAVAGPIPIKVGDFDGIEPSSRKVDVGVASLVAMAAVVVNDVESPNRDARSIVRCRPDVHRTGISDVQETSEADGSVVQIVG